MLRVSKSEFNNLLSTCVLLTYNTTLPCEYYLQYYVCLTSPEGSIKKTSHNIRIYCIKYYVVFNLI